MPNLHGAEMAAAAQWSAARLAAGMGSSGQLPRVAQGINSISYKEISHSPSPARPARSSRPQLLTPLALPAPPGAPAQPPLGRARGAGPYSPPLQCLGTIFGQHQNIEASMLGLQSFTVHAGRSASGEGAAASLAQAAPSPVSVITVSAFTHTRRGSSHLYLRQADTKGIMHMRMKLQLLADKQNWQAGGMQPAWWWVCSR